MFWVLSAVALAVLVDRLGALDVAATYLLPTALQRHLAPGFLVSNGLILLYIQQWFGSCPNFICRLCEYQMGRINRRGLLSAAVVHGIGSAALVTLLQRGLPAASLEALLGMDSGTPPPPVCSCMCEFVRETLVAAVFPVVYFVAPTLLRLNRFPVWILLFLLYPLHVTKVDATGRGSLLSPMVTVWVVRRTGRGWWRVAAQCVGGLMGGRIMSKYFPDDPKKV